MSMIRAYVNRSSAISPGCQHIWHRQLSPQSIKGHLLAHLQICLKCNRFNRSFDCQHHTSGHSLINSQQICNKCKCITYRQWVPKECRYFNFT